MRLHLTTTLVAAAVAGAALPSVATARVDVYDVTFKGSGTFTNVKRVDDDYSSWSHRTELRVGVSGRIASVAFRNGRLLSGELRGPAKVTLGGTTKMTSTSDDGTLSETCTAATEPGLRARATLTTPLVAPLTKDEALLLRPTDVIGGAWTCEGDTFGAQEGTTDLHPDVGDGALDVELVIPHEVIGKRRIALPFEGPLDTAEQQCPSQDDRTTACSGGWSGRAVFTRVRTRR